MAPGPEAAFRLALAGPNDKAVAIPHPWFRVFAQNHAGYAALVIRVALPPEVTIADGRGFAIKTERGGSDDYVRLTATATGVPLVFLKLVETILERTASAATAPSAKKALVDAVDEFRRFGANPGNRLSEGQVRGVFAELVLVRAIAERGVALADVLASWRGPFALTGLGNHDFVFPDGSAIEVKSIHQGVRQIVVASAAQLVPSSTPLDLLVLPLESASNGLPFRQYAADVTSLAVAAGPSVEQAWRDALLSLGLDLEDEWYDQYRFVVGAWERYQVTQGFPYIDVSTIPPGIVSVSYSLELARLAPFVAPFAQLIGRLGLE